MTLTTLHLSKPNTTVSDGDYGEDEPLMLLLHGVGMQLASCGQQIAIFASTHWGIAVPDAVNAILPEWLKQPTNRREMQ